MTDTSKAIAVMDAQDLAQGTPALQHRLAWLRAEGIDPDQTFHVEVFSQDDGLYAVIVSRGHQAGEVLQAEGEGADIGQTQYVIRRPVSSLPPREAAVYDLPARAGKP